MAGTFTSLHIKLQYKSNRTRAFETTNRVLTHVGAITEGRLALVNIYERKESRRLINDRKEEPFKIDRHNSQGKLEIESQHFTLPNW